MVHVYDIVWQQQRKHKLNRKGAMLPTTNEHDRLDDHVKSNHFHLTLSAVFDKSIISKHQKVKFRNQCIDLYANGAGSTNAEVFNAYIRETISAPFGKTCQCFD